MLKEDLKLLLKDPKEQFALFPGTRYMGSKNKIIESIGELLSEYEFDSIYDAFGGSNVVGYYFKTLGKKVFSNDFMALSSTLAKAIIENSHEVLNSEEMEFLINHENDQSYISEEFKGLYFSDKDNAFLDRVRRNIDDLQSEYKKAIALSALARSCMKKRPRGIFTFTGNRYDDGRRDIKMSMQEHFIDHLNSLNNAVFDNNQACVSYNEPTELLTVQSDLVYLDPPYFTPNSDNDYVRRYHFVEGLVKNWNGLTIQPHTKTKKFKSYSSPFSKRKEAYEAFELLIEKFAGSIIVISYSSNSEPTKEELIEMLARYKDNVVAHEIDHLYSFGNQSHKSGNKANRVKEYLFIAS